MQERAMPTIATKSHQNSTTTKSHKKPPKHISQQKANYWHQMLQEGALLTIIALIMCTITKLARHNEHVQALPQHTQSLYKHAQRSPQHPPSMLGAFCECVPQQLAIVGDNSVVSNYGQMAQSCTCAHACLFLNCHSGLPVPFRIGLQGMAMQCKHVRCIL